MRARLQMRVGTLYGVVLILLVGLLAIFNSAPPRALASDIQFSSLVQDTNVASAGYGGMRGIGSGTITLSGVTGSVTRALLYWHGPTNSVDPNVNATVSFAGQSVAGTNIGLSSDNCWGFTNSQAYRADVTALVTGNGSYALANFAKADAEINGASLIVFYDDGDATNNRDVVIFDGNDSNAVNPYDADGWNLALAGINYSSGSAAIQLHLSDGQRGSSFADGSVLVNGQTLLAAGQTFSGDSVPNGASASATNGGLWDITTLNVSSLLSPGDNTLNLTSSYNQDCLSLIATLIDLPAGAAPPSPAPIPPGAEPNTTSPAQLYLVQAPAPNHGAARGSLVTYTLKLVNLGEGLAKQSSLTLPLNPAAVEVVDATFSDPGAWVTAVTSDTLSIKTGPIGSDGGTLTATVRLRVKADAPDGTWLTERASLRWSDAVEGGAVLSNLPIVAVAAAADHRPTYALLVEPSSGAAGETFAFGSAIFAPEEPVGIWYNTPDGKVVAGPSYFAEADGSLIVTFNDDSLPAGAYSMVFYGHWTTFTAVGPFSIR